MTFPQVASITESQFGSSSTTHNVAMPATVNKGDLLLIFMVFGTNDNFNVPAGWSDIRRC